MSSVILKGFMLKLRIQGVVSLDIRPDPHPVISTPQGPHALPGTNTNLQGYANMIERPSVAGPSYNCSNRHPQTMHFLLLGLSTPSLMNDSVSNQLVLSRCFRDLDNLGTISAGGRGLQMLPGCLSGCSHSHET